MKANEIIEAIKQTNPKILGKMADKKAAKIVTAAFQEINKHLGTAEGAVKVPGLGTFKVRELERNKEGQQVKVKKTSFRAAKIKE